MAYKLDIGWNGRRAGFVVVPRCAYSAAAARTLRSAKLIVGSLSWPHGARLVMSSRYSRADEYRIGQQADWGGQGGRETQVVSLPCEDWEERPAQK